MSRAATAARMFCLVALCAPAGCTRPVEPVAVAPEEQEGYIDMLFIGNSLTYTNDLPDVLAALSRTMKDSAVIRVGLVGMANFNLEDHWALGTAQKAIAVGGWEYVVLQQGPSSVEVNRQQLISSTRDFSQLIVRAGATPALFSAWPQENRFVDFPRAIESYELAAAAVQGKLLPVASAWHIALTADPELRLYSDGLHPSNVGTYLTAAVIYGAVYNKSVANIPNEITTGRVRIAVASDLGARLRQAADAANKIAR